MKTKTRMICAAAVLLIAAAFLVYGVSRGEPDTVLGKAVTVCLQCIGLS